MNSKRLKITLTYRMVPLAFATTKWFVVVVGVYSSGIRIFVKRD